MGEVLEKTLAMVDVPAKRKHAIAPLVFQSSFPEKKLNRIAD
jgi:hypothetical protein